MPPKELRDSRIGLAAPRIVDRSTALGAGFDTLLAGMQKPASRKGMQAAFDAAPKMLARAAVKAARRR